MKMAIAGSWSGLVSLLRRVVRAQPVAQTLVAVIVGGLAGVCVTAMTSIADLAHVWIYGISFDERLSAKTVVSPLTAALALGLGGLVMGLIEFWRRRRKAAGDTPHSRRAEYGVRAPRTYPSQRARAACSAHRADAPAPLPGVTRSCCITA